MTSLRDLLRPVVDPAQLKADAQRAATVRAHQTDPDVIAYGVDRARAALDIGMWIGIAIGLLWTASSIQQWQAGPDPTLQQWLTAWLISPAIEIPLVIILLGEQHAARHGVTPHGWMRRARLGLLAVMLTLNVWAPASVLADPARRDVGELVVHIAVPVAIVLASEAVTDLRDTLGRAITAAAEAAARASASRPPAGRRRRRPDEQQADPDQQADERPADEPDRAPDHTDDRTDEPAGRRELVGSVRDAGVAWALEHTAAGAEPPAPREIRAGLAARYGRDVSPGECSRIRTDTVALLERRRTDSADGTDGTDDQDDEQTVAALVGTGAG